MGIRHASAEDWPAISEISTVSGYDDYINTIGPSYMNDGTLVVYEEERVLGFGKINYLEDGSAWLSGLRVHPDAQRKGVGISISRYLMQLAMEQGLTSARMLIEDRNTRSINLSLKLGFSPIKSYCFFEGTPQTSGLKIVDFKGQIMVNEGWGFVEISDIYRGKGGFMESPGKTLVYVWKGDTKLIQVVRGGGDLKAESDGITCAPEADAGSLRKNFAPLDGFESATVYGKALRA
ncbi:MAG: GNAT family N-acetyltransferase [Thermoplasmataceae archaeon]